MKDETWLDQLYKIIPTLLPQEPRREERMSALQNDQSISDDLRGRCTLQAENADDMKWRMFVGDDERALQRSQFTLHHELKWTMLWTFPLKGMFLEEAL